MSPEYKNPDLAQIQSRNIFNTLSWAEFLPLTARAANEEHKALLIFQFLVGSRPIEISNMNKERTDVYSKNSQIILRIQTAKGGFERLIVLPVCNDETDFLQAYIRKKYPKEYLFPDLARFKNPRDRFLFLNTQCKIGREYLVDGLQTFFPFPFYFFRHNMISLMYQKGLEEKLINYYFGKPLVYDIWGSQRSYAHANLDWAITISKFLRKLLKNA
jgi:hypothetical protein